MKPRGVFEQYQSLKCLTRGSQHECNKSPWLMLRAEQELQSF